MYVNVYVCIPAPVHVHVYVLFFMLYTCAHTYSMSVVQLAYLCYMEAYLCNCNAVTLLQCLTGSGGDGDILH